MPNRSAASSRSIARASCCAALVAAARPLSLRDLAAAAGMPPAKAFPHLVSLLKIGLLNRDAAGCFEAGPLALELGLIGLQRLSPTREAEPEVVELAASTGMSVAMAVLGPLGPTVVRLEESARPLHVSLRVGTVMSLANTAIGRVFAAYVADDVRAGLLAQDHLRLAGANAADVFAGKARVGQGRPYGRSGGVAAIDESLRAASCADPRGRHRHGAQPACAGHQYAGRAGAGSYGQHLPGSGVDGTERQLRQRFGGRAGADFARRDIDGCRDVLGGSATSCRAIKTARKSTSRTDASPRPLNPPPPPAHATPTSPSHAASSRASSARL